MNVMMDETNPQFPEFRKYMKFFCVRLVQSVVQSRLGHRVSTISKPQGSNCDWFNIAIDELGEVTSELRQSTVGNCFRYPPDISCLCVDIQLRTTEGEYLPLEVWSVSLDSISVDSSVNVRTQLYHSLGILLRSIISATRATPCYRQFSRQQSSDSFILCYQIYSDPPVTSQLGVGYKTVNVGSLPSPFGQINVDLYYRTKMVIGSDLESSVKKCLNIKNEECSESVKGEQPIPVPVLNRERNDGNDSDPESYPIGRPIFACSPDEPCNSVFSTSPSSFDLQVNMSFAQAEGRRSSDCQLARHNSGGSACESSCSSLQERHKTSSGNLFNLELSSEGDRIGLGDPLSTSTWPRGNPADHPFLQRQGSAPRKPSIPFAALLSASSLPEDLALPEKGEDKVESRDEKCTNLSPESGARTPTPTGEDSSDDSYVRVPLFSDDIQTDEISAEMLVRQIKGAPACLKSFGQNQENLEKVKDEELVQQLKHFHEQRSSFDNFLKNLNVSEEEDE